MSARTYQSLQLCRVLAGVAVTLFHLGGAFGSDKYFADHDLQTWTTWGHYSVVFFFVLSGFTMVRAHHDDFGHPERLWSYLRKRAIRVYPAYLIILFSVYAVARMIPPLSDSVPHDMGMMFKAALLVPQDRLVVGGTGAPVLIVAWSMQYEIAFYALIGCFILRRWLGWLVVLGLLGNYLACKLESSCSFPRAFFASNFILPFFFGAIVAWLSMGRLHFKEPLRVAAAAACIICLLRGLDVAYNINVDVLQDGTLVYGLLSGVLIVALVDAEDAGRIRLNPVWGFLAGAGYALFLLHFVLISLLCKIAMALQIRGVVAVRLTFVAIFIACLVAAQLFYKYIERPLVGYLLGLGKRRATMADRSARHEIIISPTDNHRSLILPDGVTHALEHTEARAGSEMADAAVVDGAADHQRSLAVFHR